MNELNIRIDMIYIKTQYPPWQIETLNKLQKMPQITIKLKKKAIVKNVTAKLSHSKIKDFTKSYNFVLKIFTQIEMTIAV